MLRRTFQSISRNSGFFKQLRTTATQAALKSTREFSQRATPPQPASTIKTIKLKSPTAHQPTIYDPARSKLERNTVVVVGGESQVGRAIVNRYIANGFNVVSTTQRASDHALDSRDYHLEGNVNVGHEKAHTVAYWKNLFEKIQSEHGAIHTVVNCAGISINDPVKGYTIDAVNRKPVAPMLEACITNGVKRFTYISSQAAKDEYAAARKPNSYAKSKYDAQSDIDCVMAAHPEATTQTTTFLADLVVSQDDPGHFGSPQRMSRSFVKMTVETGNTIVQPVAAIDLADAVVNVSQNNISTPRPIDACGPNAISLADLMLVYKDIQHRRFGFGLQIPVAALRPAATIRPWGAFENGHFDFIDIQKEKITHERDTTEFKAIVGRENLLTPEKTLALAKRPAFGTPDYFLYSEALLKRIKPKDVLPLAKGVAIALTQSRIDLSPHKKTAEKRANEGFSLLSVWGTLFGLGVATHAYKKSQEQDKPQAPSSSKSPIEHVAADKQARVTEEEIKAMRFGM